MATDIYKTIINPVSGETFKCIAVSAEKYTMEWILQPNGYVPFEHIHYHQDEIFHVQQGELKVVINGSDHIARQGDKIIVPKGARHKASNNKPETLVATVEYTPSLDMDTFFKCFSGLTIDGFIDKLGGVSIPMMGYCLKEMNCKAMARPTNIPAFMFNLALNAFYLAGKAKGWKKYYDKYTL